MDNERSANEEQSTLWNAGSGHAWVELQALLDDVLEPFEGLLVEEVSATSARRVLDIGCGSGATTLAVARSLGAKGRCTGVDISAPLIAAARARAEREGSRADFFCADAQTHAFAPATFDMFISRFGVMFFDDAVAAFANLRRAARPNATLRFVAWRSAAENPFMTTAERAAAPLLPQLPPRHPDAPGQFFFAGRERVHTILTSSGWNDVAIEAEDVTCEFPARALEAYLARLGPVGTVLRDADEATRARVTQAIRPAFDRYIQRGSASLGSVYWPALRAGV
jgi:SAM-dependent methyltransferase